MSSPLEPYNGLFVLQAQERIEPVESLQNSSYPVKQLCNLFDQQQGFLTLESAPYEKGEMLEGHLKFSHQLPFRLFAISINANHPLEGTLYFGTHEIPFSLYLTENLMVFLLHSPASEEDADDEQLVLKAEFQRDHGEYVTAAQPTQQYPIDQHLIGYWQKTERYFSGGLTTYTETLLHLAADGTFSQTTRSVTSPTFNKIQWTQNQSLDSGSSPRNYGQWGVIDNKLIMLLDGKALYHQTYKCSGNQFDLIFGHQHVVWKRT